MKWQGGCSVLAGRTPERGGICRPRGAVRWTSRRVLLQRAGDEGRRASLGAAATLPGPAAE
eukprot:2846886-Prymnesium_polylepis.1